MPVIMTQNNDGSVTVTGQTNAQKKITPKFFNSALTGSPQSLSRGYFNQTSHTLADKQAENDDIPDSEVHQLDRIFRRVDPVFTTNDYIEADWTFAKTTPTQLIPTLYQTAVSTGLSFTNTKLPRDTYQSNLHYLDTWAKVYTTSDLTVLGTFDIIALAEYHSRNQTDNKLVKRLDFVEQYNLVLFTGTMDDIREFKYVAADTVTITQTGELRHPLHAKYTDKHTALLISHSDATRFMSLMSAAHPDKTAFNQAVEDLPSAQSVYNNLTHHATMVVNAKMDAIEEHFALLKQLAPNTNHHELARALRQTIHHLNYFDTKDKTFFTVKDIATIQQHIQEFEPYLGHETIENLLKQNVRILLASNISKLEHSKDQLYRPTTNTKEWQDTKATWNQNADYSAQQKAIILSEEPLLIAQAGAGSGKSHTVVGRLQYLQDQKEDLNNVLVLSFTNTAADNIKERFPAIQSETIARMFDNINRETYPNQELVSIETFYNTLRLIDLDAPVFQNIPQNNDPTRVYSQEALEQIITSLKNIARDFSSSQISFKKVDHNSLIAKLVTLVSQHNTAIEAIMNAIGQTTLELEPILIHHHLAKASNALTIPKKYQHINYIITDESQDISTFEYNLLLEFVYQNKAQFFIVGDGSQTLYEFRSSDPRYMNALEASGVFATYKLTTNYRSKQAILSYANEFLKVISANEIAQIQLQSNDKTPLTLQDYKDSVILRNIASNSTKDYTEVLKEIFTIDDVEAYVLDKVRKNEQLAIVGYTRMELGIIQQALTDLFKKHNMTVSIETLIPDKNTIAAIWTTCLARVNHDLKELGVTKDINQEIRTMLTDAIDQAYRSRTPKQRAFFQSKINETLDQLYVSPHWNYMRNQYLNRTIKIGGLLSYLYNHFVRVEKREIAANNYLKSQEGVDLKDAQIILSTIHRVKGYEFDHVMVLHNAHKTKSANGSSLQELFRMYFVALSRARKSEMIINVGPDRKFISNETMFDYPMETANYLLTNELTAQTTSNQQ